MRKLCNLPAVLVMAMGVSACGGGSSDDTTDTTDTTDDIDPPDASTATPDAPVETVDASVGCDQGFDDCDDEPGCETAIADGDELNCGGCGVTCDKLQVCAVDTCITPDAAPAIAAVATDRMNLVDGTLAVTFTEPVSIGAAPTVSCLSGANTVASVTSVDDTTWTLQLAGALLAGDVCTFTWSAADVTDLDDDNAFNDAMVDDGEFTGRAIDFVEDFQDLPFVADPVRELPPGFAVANVDGRTPSASVSYVNQAWIVREDFANDLADQAAFSTSWYAPEGAADDWMFTNLIAVGEGCTLAWNAVTYDATYPDGYEVRFCAEATAATCGMVAPVFTVAAEQSAWTARTADLSGTANTTGYVAFRNNSNDKFLLLIDDITVTCP